MSGWFRLYEQVLDDPKVQSLPAETFKHWINILCLAKRNDGVLPSLSDIAFSLRISASSADKLLKTLTDRRLIDVNGDDLIPHNWNGRQYKSDVSTERVKRFRKRNETVTVTPPETETETETEKHLSALRTMNGSKRFSEFWNAYPKKVKKAESMRKWKSKHLDDKADEIIADIQIRLADDKRWKDGFIPDPTTYLNGERWNDEVSGYQ